MSLSYFLSFYTWRPLELKLYPPLTSRINIHSSACILFPFLYSANHQSNHQASVIDMDRTLRTFEKMKVLEEKNVFPGKYIFLQ